MSIDAMGPMHDDIASRWKADFEPAEDIVREQEDQPQPVQSQPRRESNIMHRWQRLLLESQMLVRNAEESVSNLNDRYNDRVLARYFDTLISDNSRKMWTVFAFSIISSGFGVRNAMFKEGDPGKWVAALGEKGFGQISQMFSTYYDSNRSIHERTKSAYDHMINAANRVAQGHVSVMTELSSIQQRLDSEKARAQAAS